MTLVIEPGNWRFDVERVPWSWQASREGVILTANGYPPASIREYPINVEQKLPSGFSIYICGSLIYTDISRDKAYFIFIDTNGDRVSAITIWEDPDYDEMSDLLYRIQDI